MGYDIEPMEFEFSDHEPMDYQIIPYDEPMDYEIITDEEPMQFWLKASTDP